MKKIASEKVEDGMVLAREVTGAAGNTLVNKGRILTTALGRRLNNWGIPFVYIEGEETVPTPAASRDETPEALKSKLLDRFSNCIDNPLMKKIFVAVYQYLMVNTNE
jgi:hypothetical protein